MAQQQNYSLEALGKRDALPNPFVIDRPTANPTPSIDGPAPVADTKPPAPADESAKQLCAALLKRIDAAAREPNIAHA
jgi:hypothetical protein